MNSQPNGGELACSSGYTETANFPDSEVTTAPEGPSTASKGGARLRRSEKHFDAAKALLNSSGPTPLLTMMNIEDVEAAYRLFKLSRPPQGPICKKYRCRFCNKKFRSNESLIKHHLKRYLRLQAKAES